MKTNMTPPMEAKDYQGLADSLMKAATFAPAGYTNWASIAKDGADAARAADLDAVKAACRGCHDQYKNQYRTEMSARPLPVSLRTLTPSGVAKRVAPLEPAAAAP